MIAHIVCVISRGILYVIRKCCLQYFHPNAATNVPQTDDHS